MNSSITEWLPTEEETKHELLVDKLKKTSTLTKKELQKLKTIFQSSQIKTCFHIQEQTQQVTNIAKWMGTGSPLPLLFRASALVYMSVEMCNEKLNLLKNKSDDTQATFTSNEYTHIIAYVSTLESLFHTIKHKHKMSLSFDEVLQ